MSNRQDFPFAPIEEYMLLDDSSAYPMDSIRMLHFSGTLSEKALREAFATICERHLLLTCRAERAGVHFKWTPAEKKPELIWRRVEEEPGCLNASGFPNMRKLDLFQEPGFRVYVTESRKENWTKVLLQFHHSVSDGLGEMQVIGELLTLYARFLGFIPKDTQLPKLYPEKLRLRYRLGWSIRGYFRNFIHTDVTTRQLAFGNPKPLLPHTPISKDVPPVGGGGDHYCSRSS